MSFKKDNLDRFYTTRNQAEKYFDVVRNITENSFNEAIFIEPSAGDGSFFELFPIERRFGIDINPAAVGIIKNDFLKMRFDNLNTKSPIFVIGNPPFGRNSSLAIKFFNKAAMFSDLITFILPRTFRKISIIRKLNDNFHLLYDEIVPQNSFILNKKSYNIKSVFQIWTKKAIKRPKIPKAKTNDFEFIKNKNLCNIAIRRVGGNAGLVIINNDAINQTNQECFWYIKAKNPQKVMKIINSFDWKTIGDNTVGPRSISSEEIISIYNKLIYKN